jgi:hypothetical protein
VAVFEIRARVELKNKVAASLAVGGVMLVARETAMVAHYAAVLLVVGGGVFYPDQLTHLVIGHTNSVGRSRRQLCHPEVGLGILLGHRSTQWPSTMEDA